MNYLTGKLDTTWKRLLAAGALSGIIILSISTFAESTYVQSQKLQQESARGQHCKKWQLKKSGDQTNVICLKWATK